MTKQAPEFDHIIIGAGSAGCVLAYRLSENPKTRVLLLEAGPGWHHPFSDMPRGWVTLTSHAKRAWGFPVEAEHGRPENETWARGRGVGGSSAINGLVYCRGAAQDYDSWSQFGITGWSASDMHKAFNAMEKNANHGLLEISTRPLAEPLRSAVTDAGISMNLEPRDTIDGGAKEAVGTYLHSVDAKGRRSSAGRVFLDPARKRPNLTIKSSARASRIVFEGKRAIGVTYVVKGKPHTSLAHETIVSCGTIQSPQLLQVSGIGPAKVLSAAGVDPIIDLPGVGENLAEHLVVALPHRLKNFPSHNARLRGPRLFLEVMRYFLTGTGLMSYGASEMGAFVRSSDAIDYPDIQISLSPYTFARGLLQGRLRLEAKPGITLIGYALRPQSRGQISIKSASVEEPPRIEARWLDDKRDQKIAVAMIRALRQFAAQPSLAHYLETELWPGENITDDAKLLSAFRANFVSGLHAVGTCRMGDDKMAVVDADLKVHGVEGLRIVDASVAPSPISSNTNGPIMAMAWLASDRILRGQQHVHRD